MKTRVLFVITGDPRISPRPAEAVRIAAGAGVWEKVEISVYLHGDATLALDECADELTDGELYLQCLPLLAGFGRPIYAERGALDRLKTKRADWPVKEITVDELAALCAAQTSVLRF